MHDGKGAERKTVNGCAIVSSQRVFSGAKFKLIIEGRQEACRLTAKRVIERREFALGTRFLRSDAPGHHVAFAHAHQDVMHRIGRCPIQNPVPDLAWSTGSQFRAANWTSGKRIDHALA